MEEVKVTSIFTRWFNNLNESDKCAIIGEYYLMTLDTISSASKNDIASFRENHKLPDMSLVIQKEKQEATENAEPIDIKPEGADRGLFGDTYNVLVGSDIAPIIGQMGEEFVKNAIGGYIFEDGTHTPHKGDFILKHQGNSILLEVKNMKIAVPKTGVDKFHNNLGDGYCEAGMIVSLRSGISSKGIYEVGNWNGKRTLYISMLPFRDNKKFVKDILVCGIKLLSTLIEKNWEIDIEEHVRKMQEVISSITNMKQKLSQCCTSINEVIADLYIQGYRITSAIGAISSDSDYEILEEGKNQIEFFSHKQAIRDLTLGMISDDCKISQKGKFYMWTSNNSKYKVEILKTMVYFHTETEKVTNPMPNFTFKNGWWRIKVDRSNMDIITKCLS